MLNDWWWDSKTVDREGPGSRALLCCQASLPLWMVLFSMQKIRFPYALIAVFRGAGETPLEPSSYAGDSFEGTVSEWRRAGKYLCLHRTVMKSKDPCSWCSLQLLYLYPVWQLKPISDIGQSTGCAKLGLSALVYSFLHLCDLIWSLLHLPQFGMMLSKHFRVLFKVCLAL